MKKLQLFLTLAILVFVAACGDNNTESSDGNGETVNLRISSGLPDSHQWMIGFFNPMLEEVEENSDGQFEHTLYTSGELVETTEELEALNTGQIDVAIPLHPVYDSERFPLTEVTMLPLLTSDVAIATEAYNNMLSSDEELEDGMNFVELVYGQHDLKVLPMVSTQPYVIATTETEITTPSDLNGLQLRSGARVHDIFTSNIDATPISLPFTDLYDGLTRGTLDGTLLAVPDWSSYGIESLFSHTLEGINIGHYSAVTAMTMDTWESLPGSVQTAFEDASQNHLQTGIDNWLEVNETVVDESTASGGTFTNIEDLDQELQDIFNDAIETTWLQWIDTVEAQGYPAKEVAIIWRDLIVEAGGEVPEGVMNIE